MYSFFKLCVFFITYVFISVADADIINIELNFNSEQFGRCEIKNQNVTITEGDRVELTSKKDKYLDVTSFIITDQIGRSHVMFANQSWPANNGVINYTIPDITANYSGNWSFELLRSPKMNIQPQRFYNEHNYTVAYCDAKIVVQKRIIPTPWPLYIGSAGSLVLIVILTQTIVIIYLKKKARNLLRDRTLQPKNKSGTDSTRYSLTPGQRKVSKSKKRSDSGIYETLDEIRLKNLQPPEPPAIDTLPRKHGPKPLPSTLEKKQLLPPVHEIPNSHPMTPDVEIDRIKDRPQFPLPNEETYEEMDTEDNIYEPPLYIPTTENVRARPPVTHKLPAFPIPLSLPGKRMEHPSKATRPELVSKPVVLPKLAKPEKPAKPEKAVKPEKAAKPEKPAKLEKPAKPEKAVKILKSMKSDPNPKVTNELNTLLKKKRHETNPPMMVNELDSILKKRRDVANKTAASPPVVTASATAAPSFPRIPPKSPVFPRPSTSNTNTQTRKQPVPNQPAPAPLVATANPTPSLPRVPPKSPVMARPSNNTNTQTRKQPAPPPITKPICPLPAPTPVHVPVTLQNEEPNSSDEEWTYEALPQYNIYSI